jgi:uncharacterized protein
MPKAIRPLLAAISVAFAVAGLAVSAAEIKGNAGATPAAGTHMEALYRSVTVVTGTRLQTRLPGFAQCLGDVLVKVTGDQTILKDRRFQHATAQAANYVWSFSYRDRLAGRPYHDEQGAHDRPHNLTVDFDHAAIDALARSLGREPWLSTRPRVVVFLGVEGIKATYMLARDGVAGRSEDMREAFVAAAAQAALPVAFPTLAQFEAHGWSAKTLPEAALADAGAVARGDGGDVAVIGHMVFSDKALGWIASWRMEDRGKAYAWSVRGVNFDAAFRNALFGAAQILSGHGQPG